MTKEKIVHHATATIGFDLCRISTPFVSEHLEEYRSWINNQEEGDMQYLARHLPMKENPNLLLEGVQSAVVVAKNYKNTNKQYLKGNRKIARYAVGKDYHSILQVQLEALATFIKSLYPYAKTYVGVDSRPIPERSLALQAGIGFRGKNTMVIRPKMGSYFLLGVLYTTIPLAQDTPFQGSCGTCTRCIDACPTKALTDEGKMIAKRCISYATIEHKSVLDTSVINAMDGWIFGCDICQEVCPFNHVHIPLTNWSDFYPESGVGFDFFKEDREKSCEEIPKNSALYRSRKRVIGNLRSLKKERP